METKTATAKVETAFGQPQPKDKQEYVYEYRVFSSAEEANNAGFNYVDLANTAEKNNEKSKAYQAAIAWAKPDPNSAEVMRENAIKLNQKMYKLDRESAEKLVDGMAKAAAQLSSK